MSNENLNAPTEEENTKPLIIDINRNIGTSTDEKAVVMPEKVKVDDPTVEAEIEDPNIESENKLLNTETTIANNVANEIEQETTDNSLKKISEQEEIKLPGEEQEIVFPDDAFGTKKRTSIDITKDMEAAIELYSTFSKEIGPYVTLEQTKKIIANNYNSDVIGSVVQEIETSKANDIKSFENDGRDFNLVNKSLNEIRTVLKDKERPDLAQKVNLGNVKEILADLKTEGVSVEDKLVYQLAGIDSELDGVNANTRTVMSFAKYDDKTIATQAHDAIVATLPDKYKEIYQSLNYGGNKIHTQNYEFADGKRRLIYKIPEELGGDNKYRLFNKPGFEAKDVSGFTGEIAVMSAEITAGILATGGGPSAVALSSGVAGGIAELGKLMYGQSLGVNLDMTQEDMIIEAMKRAAITGGATRVSIPIFNAAFKQFKNLFAKQSLGSAITGQKGTLPSKIRDDFVKAYKSGLSNEQKTAQIQQFKEALISRTGMDEVTARKFVYETFGANIPKSSLAKIEQLTKSNFESSSRFVNAEGRQAILNQEREFLEAQAKVLEKQFGISLETIKKSGVKSQVEINDKIINIAKATSEFDKAALITEKEALNEAWLKIIKNSTNKLYPDELSINKTLTSIIGVAKDNNIKLGGLISAQQDQFMKGVFVTFPKNSVKSNVTIPKFIDDNISQLNKQIQLLRKDKIVTPSSEKRLLQLDDTIKSLKIVKGQFQRGGSVEYNKVQSIKDTLEGLSEVNPALDKVVREVLFKFSTLSSEAARRVPAYAKLMKDNANYFNQQTLLRDGVLSKIIKKVGGTSRGEVSGARAVMGEDFFPMLFGNKIEQVNAAAYIGTLVKGNQGQLSKAKINEFKTLIYNRFIQDIDQGGMKVADWYKQYLPSIKQVLGPEDLAKLRNVGTAKEAVENFALTEAKLTTEAKRAFPKIFNNLNLVADDLNSFQIATQILENPNITPKAFNKFFAAIGKENQQEVKAYYLNNLFTDNRASSKLLGKDTLDAGGIFKHISDPKNEQIFQNMFGKETTKSFKTIMAAMDFMENTGRFMKGPGGKVLSEAEMEQIRQTATRMIYGPLSHENVVIKGLLFFANKLDGKLGKELADYDLFLEKFANSYAFKYAPALNDKKFLGYFNTYTKGPWQRFGVGTMTAVGGEGTNQTVKGLKNAETGLPTIPVLEAIASAPVKSVNKAASFSYESLRKLAEAGEFNKFTKREKNEIDKYEKAK
jgi:hypothetical protein